MKIRTACNDDLSDIIRLVKDTLSEFEFVYSSKTSELDLLDLEEESIWKGGTFIILEYNQKHLIVTGAIKKSFKHQIIY
jgi:hypothetical protein